MKKIETVEQALEEISKLQAQLDEKNEKDIQAALDAKESELTEAQKTISEKEEALSVAKDQLEQIKASADEKDKELEAAKTELETLKVEARTQKRFADLEAAGVVLDDEKREKYKNYSDEAFEAVLSVFKDYPTAELTKIKPKGEEDDEEDGEEEKPTKKSTRKSTKKDEEAEETDASEEDFEDLEDEDGDEVDEDNDETEEEDDDVSATLVAALRKHAKARNEK